MALDETITNGETGHIAAHAELKAEYTAAGATPAIADYTSLSTPAQHATIHNALHARHNSLGGAALPVNLTGASTGFLAYHSALHASYNARSAPAAPATPAVSAGNTQVTVTWTTPAAGVSPITGYDVLNVNTGTVTSVGVVTTTTITGLANYTTYTFRVRAKSAAGVGAYSAASAGTTPGTPLPTGMRGWWKADAIASPPANGADLALWTDSSTGGQPFVAGAVAPTYWSSGSFLANGKPAVRFSRTGLTQMTSSVDNNTASTKFVVMRISSYGGGSSFYGAVGTGYELGIGPGGKFDAFAGNTIINRTGTADGAVIPINTWHILTFTGNGTNLSATYLDGVADGPSSAAGHTVSSTSTLLGSSDGGGYFDGYIAEVIDYPRVLDSTELGQVHTSLITKYNIGASDPTPVVGLFRDMDFDDSEDQAFTHSASGFQVGSAHQHAWINTLTRLGTGRAERFECHGPNAGDIANGTSYRAMMDVVDTNDGGDTVGNVVGYPEVYYAISTYWPTVSGTPAHATVSPGFSQVSLPFESILEIHERGNINGGIQGINNLNQVTNHHIGLRNGQLQYRGCCGTWTWNGTSWNQPAWNTGTPGTTGKNDQIPIPIVKPGGTNATMVADAWVDIILHIRFSKTSTGLVEIWARQAGQAFTTGPNLTINGPTHKVAVGSDGVTRSSADYEAANLVTGSYFHCGLYPAGTTWGDSTNGAHVQIIDELRRWGTLAEAKANWG